MSLSEWERRELARLEEQLAADDPGLNDSLSPARRRAPAVSGRTRPEPARGYTVTVLVLVAAALAAVLLVAAIIFGGPGLVVVGLCLVCAGLRLHRWQFAAAGKYFRFPSPGAAGPQLGPGRRHAGADGQV